ncbi:MAG: hypothetical protein GY847_23535 [Proteobacteria bacterium]|nr:hypothetical protein [Pseudomonadota bacterium]
MDRQERKLPAAEVLLKTRTDRFVGKLRSIKALLPREPNEVYQFAKDISGLRWGPYIVPRNFAWMVEELLDGYRHGVMPLTGQKVDSALVGLTDETYMLLKNAIPRILKTTTPAGFFQATACFFYPDYLAEHKTRAPRTNQF